MKLHLKILNEEEGSTLYAYMKAAERKIEKMSGVRLLPCTLQMTLDQFPCNELKIPIFPIREIASVKYYDSTNTLITIDDEDYFTDLKSLVPRVFPKVSWPTTYRRPNAVEIEFEAGYASGDAIPEIFKQGIRILVGALFEHREASDEYMKIESAVASLLGYERSYA